MREEKTCILVILLVPTYIAVRNGDEITWTFNHIQ